MSAHDELWMDFVDALVAALDQNDAPELEDPEVGTIAHRLVHLVVLHGLLPETEDPQ